MRRILVGVLGAALSGCTAASLSAPSTDRIESGPIGATPEATLDSDRKTPPPEPHRAASAAQEPAKSAHAPQTEWYDLRFLTKDPDSPIRMLGPDGEKLSFRQTRTRRQEFGYLLPVGEDGVFHVRVRAHRFYVPAGAVVEETINYADTARVTDLIHEFYYRLIGKEYRVLENGYAEERRGRFVKVDGKPVDISFASSDPSVVAVSRLRDSADRLTFRRPGNVRLIVMLGDDVLARIPLEVLASPVHVGMSNEELLKTLGFPSDEATAYASWPSGMSLNRKFYKPTAAQGGIAIKHVRYGDYPELVVGLDSEGSVRSVHSNSEHVRNR